jgi:hypothetical protein
VKGFLKIGTDFKKSLKVLPFLNVLIFGMLAFTLHDSFGQVDILFFDLELAKVSRDVFGLRRKAFSGRLAGKELVVRPSHDNLDGFGMLGSSHLVLETFHDVSSKNQFFLN